MASDVTERPGPLRMGRLKPTAGWLPGAAVVMVVGLYQALYAFAYFPITEGWFSTYSSLMRAGSVPYRDFSLLMPPLYPLQLALIQWLFGEGLIVLRVLGVFINCAIALTLWSLLSRFFPRWVSVFAALCAVIYYQSGNAFIGYDFTQVLTLYVLLGGLFILHDLDRGDQKAGVWFLPTPAFASGFMLSAATLTKQSNGGLATIVISAAFGLVLLRTLTLPMAATRIAHFVAGALFLLLPVLAWLGMMGALPAFFQQVVFDAMAAKGGGEAIFGSWAQGFFGDTAYVAHLLELLAHLVPIILISGIPAAVLLVAMQVRPKWFSFATIVVGLVGTTGLIITITLIWSSGTILNLAWRDQAALIYNNALLLSVHVYIVGGLATLLWLLWRPSPRNSKLFMVLMLGLGMTIGNGTSAGLSEISAFLAVAMAIAALMSIAAPTLLPATIPVALSLLFCAFLIEKKFELPYAWWSVETADVRNAVCAPTTGILWGICIEPQKYETIFEVTAAIRGATEPGDRLYVFPHEPIFNLLTDVPPYENAVVSWFDFMSLQQGSDLVAALSSSPPKAILLSRLPDVVFEAHERMFNQGRPSIQREIVEAIDNLIAAGRLARSLQVEIDGIRLELFERVPN